MLFPFQKTGIKFLLEHDKCMLLDEVGLGKTVQCIIACQILKARKVLVICPASVRINWKREFEKWSTKEFHSKLELEIVSYAYIQTKAKAVTLSLTQWDVVIADESHNIKSWSAKQTKNFCQVIAPKARRLWLLTATPATRAASDYHTQLSVVSPGQHGTFGQFCENFCIKKKSIFNPRGYEYVGFKNEDILNTIVKKVSLRRTRDDIELELPERIYGTLYSIPNQKVLASELNVYPEIIQACIESGRPIPEHVAKVRLAVGLSKVHPLAEWIADYQKPTVVFGWHKAVIRTFVQECQERGKKVDCITGETHPLDRQEKIDAFQKGELDVLVLAIAAAGVGISLPFADTCIFLELPWSPALYEQAIGRITRIDSKHHTHYIYDCICTGTIDEHVKKILDTKKVGMEAVLK